MEQFIGHSAVTYWHQFCTAKMGGDALSVVDHRLKVYGIEHLRIADASIMPRITVGNTMAPCVVIGERAADLIIAASGLECRAEPALQPPGSMPVGVQKFLIMLGRFGRPLKHRHVAAVFHDHHRGLLQ